MGRRIARVGVVGAGAATQAIHLPTLARFPERFRVTAVTDVNEAVAVEVADRVGAAVMPSLGDMLAADKLDVVVICSPNEFHAEQVSAACRARVGVVLCEKPLATSRSEAEDIARVSEETGVPVVVGTMHSFDPVWQAASRRWTEAGAQAHTIRIAARIPPNPMTEDLATEVTGRAGPGRTTRSRSRLKDRVAGLRGGVLGLAIHDLPLARRLLPDAPPRVLAVHEPAPGGYHIFAEVGGQLLEVLGGSSETWLPDWQLEAIAEDAVLLADFGPSYVHAGSAVAELSMPAAETGFETTRLGPAVDNGYVRLWQSIDDLLDGRGAAPPVEALVADLDFAVLLADQATDLLLTASAPTTAEAI
ncbi:Gfo/Idh/MocA family protein [Georgenia deserti]|uniref:Gfo/Idh/MocA family protein n=1 Tax=Georgenia deserti TaxID=2093781 RepID=A0ABW4LBG0_9MICO